MNKLHPIPFCIFHYNDTSTNTYRGFIHNPYKLADQNGQKIFKCKSILKSYGSWKFYNTFYAFSPMLRPIPTGLKLINSNTLGSYPYSTKNIDYGYDPFDVQPKNVSFLTWSRPVNNTVPLYLHISPEGRSYPSFDPNPPHKNGWTKNIMSPLYVLVDPKEYNGPEKYKKTLPNYKRDKYGIPIFNFSSIDGRCLPTPNGISLDKCFLLTDENILEKEQPTWYRPLLDQLKQEEEKPKPIKKHQYFSNKNRLKKFFINLSPTIIILFISLFFSSLIISIIILSK
jgi:hypothetical protein